MPDKKIFLNSGPSKPDLPKSTFDKSFTNHLTARFGRLYPVFVEEAVPGSTYHIKPTLAFDMMPMAFPIQSRMRCHISFFNVPFRITWKNYKDFFSRVGDHVMPYISRENWTGVHTLSDYIGVPSTSFSSISRKKEVLNLSRYSFAPPIAPHDQIISVDTSDLSIHTRFYFQDFSNYFFVNPLFSSTDFAVLSDYLVHPFATPFVEYRVVANRLPSSSIGNLYLYMMLSDKNQHKVVLISIDSLSNRQHFVYTSTNPNTTVGAYAFTGTGSFTLSNGSSVSSVLLQFNLRQSAIDVINTFINDINFDVQLVFVYPHSASQYLGNSHNLSGYGLVPDKPLDDITHLELVSNKDETTQVTSYSSSRLSNNYLASSFYYNAIVVNEGFGLRPFDSVSGAAPRLPINALPFRAYEFIFNKYFRNQQVDPFYKNGEVSYNQFLTNDDDGADSTTPVDFFNVPYEYDEFTTALLSPQQGFAPLVGVTTNDAEGLGFLNMVPLDSSGNPDPADAYKIGVEYDTETGSITGVSNYEEVANRSSVHRLMEAIDFGISINDFRNVSAFQRMKEKALKAGYQFEDLHKEFFGTTPPIGEEFPEYLGGVTRDILIGKLQNQALTDDHPLGEFAGVGSVSGKGETIKVFVKEPSYIMGVMWFSVTPVYSQSIPKHLLKHQYLDYFNPVLNSIGAQPIYRHEIAPLQLDEDHLMDVFGYQRPWYDYVSRKDEAHGAFRGNMANYLLQRIFLEAPELTRNFINIYSDELTDIFTVTEDTDKFFGMIHFDVKCKSPVARISVPRIIG